MKTPNEYLTEMVKVLDVAIEGLIKIAKEIKEILEKQKSK